MHFFGLCGSTITKENDFEIMDESWTSCSLTAKISHHSWNYDSVYPKSTKQTFQSGVKESIVSPFLINEDVIIFNVRAQLSK